MKISINNIKNRDGGDDVVPSLLKSELVLWLSKINYCNIIYLCCDKGYIYRKELESYLLINAKHHISYLVREGILEEFELDKTSLDNLKLIKGLNDKNVIFLTTYRLTSDAKVLLQNPFIYDLMCENTSNSVKKYKDSLIDIYNKKMSKIKEDKEKELLEKMTRYNIAKRKNPTYRTAEDYAIIQEVENNG